MAKKFRSSLACLNSFLNWAIKLNPCSLWPQKEGGKKKKKKKTHAVEGEEV
jgi:hypothetical protein